MKFAIGYQQNPNGESFTKIVRDYREYIEEVYFAWVGVQSGRARLGIDTDGAKIPEAESILQEDICEIRKIGIKLDLLLNANCYGRLANSAKLQDNVKFLISHIDNLCGMPEVLTTTSPAIAYIIRKNFPQIEIRASVNMRIGTIQAMEYISDLFDGFYIQRDVQRNLEYLKKMHGWCKGHEKKLFILANSGCLRYCPGQIFHDNAVSHDAESGGESGDIPGWNPHTCWRLYSNKDNIAEFLKSTWIRPEDIHLYEGFADLIKLATRQTSHPRMIIHAYISGKFNGNLMNLTEPCFSHLFAPKYIDNSAFPSDWGKRTSSCNGNCNGCNYCNNVLKEVMKSYESY